MRSRKTFTEEELKEIRKNPYVRRVTEKTISFTVSFKEEFWKRYDEENKSVYEIVKELGFDPEVLGTSRINGILTCIKAQANSGEPFRDSNRRLERVSDADYDLPQTTAVQKLQTKVAYLEQELEFIKKNILADHSMKQKR